MIHSSGDIIGSKSNILQGKKIVLGITGSVACVRSIDIARELMRNGAEVFPVMSEAATKLIGPDLVEWACGNKPVLQLTGAIEHVALAGNTSTKADLFLVAPSTANTIGKIANGIDDTAVTTFATTAIGEGMPVVVVPAMHEPMYRHQAVLENIEKLKILGIKVLIPKVEEGKAKIPETADIVSAVVARLSGADDSLAGKRVLITAGRTVEYIDPVRLISNNSSGKMGMALAEICRDFGAEVTVVYGKGTAAVPAGVDCIHCDTTDNMKDMVFSELGKQQYDYLFAAAAVGDWKPKKQAADKISTHDNSAITIELVPTPKIIDEVKKAFPDTVLIAFRALYDMTEKSLLENASKRMKKAGADFIAVNDVSTKGAGFESDTNEMFLLRCNGDKTHIPMTSKKEVARTLVNLVVQET